MSTAGPIKASHPHHHAAPQPRTAAGDHGGAAFAALLTDKPAGPVPAASAAPPAAAGGLAARGAAPAHGASAAASVAALAPGLAHFVGRCTGSGQCVALVRAATPAVGATAHWIKGAPVQGNTSLPPGTPIATFDQHGRYANAVDGSSHAAIYLGQTSFGVQVLDQWSGKPASVRTIPWEHAGASAANTGAAFHVVDSALPG